MLPDDERHGTVAGYSTHLRESVEMCDLCRRAQSRYLKKWKLENISGRRVSVPALGSVRRVQALMRLGWTMHSIADQAGVGIGTIHRVSRGERPMVYRDVAAGIRHAYDRLSGRAGGSLATARRAAAAGWPAPLAWDDIDDPADRAKGARDVA